MSNNWFTRPSITPWQMAFWVFMAIQYGPLMSHYLLKLGPSPTHDFAASIYWDVGSNMVAMLVVVFAATVFAYLGTVMRQGNRAGT